MTSTATERSISAANGWHNPPVRVCRVLSALPKPAIPNPLMNLARDSTGRVYIVVLSYSEISGQKRTECFYPLWLEHELEHSDVELHVTFVAGLAIEICNPFGPNVCERLQEDAIQKSLKVEGMFGRVANT
jgi:hypothetical protein